jgi:hypothetical protein
MDSDSRFLGIPMMGDSKWKGLPITDDSRRIRLPITGDSRWIRPPGTETIGSCLKRLQKIGPGKELVLETAETPLYRFHKLNNSNI